MPIKLVTGSEPTIAEALAWLGRRGLQPREIRGIAIDAQVGQPLMITATFIVSDPSEVTISEADAPALPSCGVAGHPSTSHVCRSHGIPIAFPPVAADWHPGHLDGIPETEAVPDAKQE